MKNPNRHFGDRKDGTWLRDLDSMHAFVPYIYTNRADSEAFIEETIDLTAVDAYHWKPKTRQTRLSATPFSSWFQLLF